MKKTNMSGRKFKVIKREKTKEKNNLWGVMNMWFAMSRSGQL